MSLLPGGRRIILLIVERDGPSEVKVLANIRQRARAVLVPLVSPKGFIVLRLV